MRSKIAILATAIALTLSLSAQTASENPRVFITGKGSVDVNSDGASSGNLWFRAASSRSTIDSHESAVFPENREICREFSAGLP